MKKILIALPTARYIECETFKCIYDLIIPPGYDVQFQYFHGYRIDQVRNLISDWVVRGFDYLFSIDHDVTFAPDTLVKMLNHDVPLVAGVYRQRVPEQKIEIYDLNQRRMTIEQLYQGAQDLVEIGGCGFGCVLIKREVIAAIGYPQFEYHVALDHNYTISEDTDFCRKAMNKGYKLWCDRTILCGHIGSTTMSVALPAETVVAGDRVKHRLKELHDMRLLPTQHITYLQHLRNALDIHPSVIFDIGASVLHWAKEAQQVWPEADIIPFEAMDEVCDLYHGAGFTTACTGCLLGSENREVEFYQNLLHPGGNSIYRENPEFSPAAAHLFGDGSRVIKKVQRLDDIVAAQQLPQPTLIKMDVQGAELDVLIGAEKTLRKCQHLILELQHVSYNIGAPHADAVINYLTAIGFKLVGDGPFCGTQGDVDADYHFTRED